MRIACLLTLIVTSAVYAQPNLRDTYSDAWTAADALGRSVATSSHTGPPRKDRFVGMFYFLWAEPSIKEGPYDISRILANDPDAMSKSTSPPWGPISKFHHWGQPLFGYYLSDDPWVIRKHGQMLADAGVDTLIFDTSNKLTYPDVYMKLLEVFDRMRKAGNRTPQVAFLTPFGDPATTVQKLYDELYSKNLYPHLWFQWDGKPLILADPAKCDPKFRTFFTFRTPQPDYFQGPTKPDMWSWLEIYPQHMFKNSKGENEQMSVGVAQNAVGSRLGSLSEKGSRGRSFHDGKIDARPDAVNYGFNFAEQFEYALKQDPKFIFITGWNEWIAGRWPEFNGVKGNMFPDEFDQEGSRDIEPMQGGHGDNYYYQLVSYIRRYKGTRSAPIASGPKTIDIKGDFSQWADVTPDYLDDINDTAHRSHAGFGTITRYTNATGRNDFVLMKVAHDANNLYFCAQTKDPITPCTDPNWMTLFLNIDTDGTTGWHGYDFVVNRQIKDSSHSTLEWTRTGWNWQERAIVPFKVAGNQLMLSIPRSAVGLNDQAKPLHFEFKWADNFRDDDSITSFTLYGDAAPNGRFNYVYQTR